MRQPLPGARELARTVIARDKHRGRANEQGFKTDPIAADRTLLQSGEAQPVGARRARRQSLAAGR